MTERAAAAAIATAILIASWALIGMILVPREAITLAAAHLFSSAAFDLFNVNTRAATRRGEAAQFVFSVEAVATLCCICVGALICGLLMLGGRDDVALLTGFCLAGTPARFNSFARVRFHPGRQFRIVRNSYFLAGALAVAAIAPSAIAFAVVLALREYATLIHSLSMKTRRNRPGDAPDEDEYDDDIVAAEQPGMTLDLTGWRGIAVATAFRSKARFAFLLSKLLLTGVGGPVGHIIASTSRSAGAIRGASYDRRVIFIIAAAAFVLATAAMLLVLIPLAKQSTYWLAAIGIALRIAATSMHVIASHWLEKQARRQPVSG